MTDTIDRLAGLAADATAQQAAVALGMAPIPGEGGWWAPGTRSAELSSITALIGPDGASFSAWHRLTIHEGWQWLAGAALRLSMLAGTGALTDHLLDAAHPQALVPRGTWQGARSLGRWTLIGCWCAPQFTDDSFELGGRSALTDTFPQHAAAIAALTRDGSDVQR